jgi:copper(I)-binding protein
MRFHLILPALALVLLAASACVRAQAGVDQTRAPAEVGSEAAVEGIQISGAWVRVAGGPAMPSPVAGGDGMHEATAAQDTMAPRNGAAYMTIRNTGAGPDRLLSALSEAAGAVEIHETSEEGGVIKMRPVDGIEIPPGGQVELKSGSYHLMLLGLADAVEPGYLLELELKFEQAGAVRVRAEVRRP